MSLDSPLVTAVRKVGGKGGEGTLFGMSPWGMLASLLFSGIGYYYVKRGRDQGDMTRIGCGIALMLYPYFLSNALYIVLVGAALMAVPAVLERF